MRVEVRRWERKAECGSPAAAFQIAQASAWSASNSGSCLLSSGLYNTSIEVGAGEFQTRAYSISKPSHYPLNDRLEAMGQRMYDPGVRKAGGLEIRLGGVTP